MEAFLRFHSQLVHVVNVVCVVLIAVIAVVVCFQVFSRYVMSISAPWAEELLRLLFVWLVMAGAANSSHMRLDLFDRTTLAMGKSISLFEAAFSLLILVLLSYGALDMIELTAYDRYSSLNLSVQWAYFGFGAGLVLWFLNVIRAYVDERAGQGEASR